MYVAWSRRNMPKYSNITWDLSVVTYSNVTLGYHYALPNTTVCNLDSSNNSSCVLESDPIVITPLEIVISVLLSGFILAIIIGNVSVILSVALFREMRTLSNGLIASLASADLLVALIVSPISLQREIIGKWILGVYVCEFWITSDVFCCTASILNIVVIALDRYWLITKNVRYTHNSTFSRKRICFLMIVLAWISSAIISSSPLFGWKAGHETTQPSQCIISQDLGYTVFSTFGSFWCPLALILAVYAKIFKIARQRARTRAKASRIVHPSMNSSMLTEINGKQSRFQRSSDSNSPPFLPRHAKNGHARNGSKEEGGSKHVPQYTRRFRGRTRSSARTLGLIIGCFILCWFPFFMIATIQPFCSICHVPRIVESLTLWLGYSNSLLNPAIYAIWDKNFRRSFRRLGHCDIRWNSIL